MTRYPKRASVIGALLLVAAACGDGVEDAPSAVTVVGTDTLAFEPAELTAAAGTVTVELTSETAVDHTFVIEELGDVEVVAAGPGETATGEVELEPGSYTFYCDVPGHREAGMEGTLLVVPDGGSHEDLEEFFQDLHG